MEPDRDLRLRLPLSGSHWGPSWVLRRPSGQRWRLGVVGAPAGCWPPARSPPCSAAQPGAHVAWPCGPRAAVGRAALRLWPPPAGRSGPARGKGGVCGFPTGARARAKCCRDSGEAAQGISHGAGIAVGGLGLWGTPRTC